MKQFRRRSVVFLPVLLMPTVVLANEVMTDRCSADVSIVYNYGDKPLTNGAVLLHRGPNGWSDWTPPFRVTLSKDGYIRWWCNSTTGNWLDPGTWRWRDGAVVGVDCNWGGYYPGDETIKPYPKKLGGHCDPIRKFPLTTSNWQGWTAERSRCKNRSTLIRARLGPDRVLNIECLGH